MLFRNTLVGEVLRNANLHAEGTNGIDCGICTDVCPRGNYEQTSSGIRMTGDCEYCFACIQNCPQKAIRFAPSAFPNGKEVNPNARYRNEYVSLAELKLANNQKG